MHKEFEVILENDKKVMSIKLKISLLLLFMLSPVIAFADVGMTKFPLRDDGFFDAIICWLWVCALVLCIEAICLSVFAKVKLYKAAGFSIVINLASFIFGLAFNHYANYKYTWLSAWLLTLIVEGIVVFIVTYIADIKANKLLLFLGLFVGNSAGYLGLIGTKAILATEVQTYIGTVFMLSAVLSIAFFIFVMRQAVIEENKREI